MSSANLGHIPKQEFNAHRVYKKLVHKMICQLLDWQQLNDFNYGLVSSRPKFLTNVD